MAGVDRRNRLTGPRAFARVLRHGRRHEGEYLQLVSAMAAGDGGRYGFVIGRKALPRAVDRNRVRRMLRVVMRDARSAVDRFDVIVRLKRGAPRAEFPLVVAEAIRLLAGVATESRAR